MSDKIDFTVDLVIEDYFTFEKKKKEQADKCGGGCSSGGCGGSKPSSGCGGCAGSCGPKKNMTISYLELKKGDVSQPLAMVGANEMYDTSRSERLEIKVDSFDKQSLKLNEKSTDFLNDLSGRLKTEYKSEKELWESLDEAIAKYKKA